MLQSGREREKQLGRIPICRILEQYYKFFVLGWTRKEAAFSYAPAMYAADSTIHWPSEVWQLISIIIRAPLRIFPSFLIPVRRRQIAHARQRGRAFLSQRLPSRLHLRARGSQFTPTAASGDPDARVQPEGA
jgi:hypothetical protein